jgi:hypothetical protein
MSDRFPFLLDEGARASVVNRTHRVIREQATSMREQRKTQRNLWLPLTVCSAVLMVATYGMWRVLDADDVTPSGIPDASGQMMVLLMWILPVTAALICWVFLRRNRANRESRL